MSRRTTHRFDQVEFRRLLDDARQRRGLTWRQVAEVTGCASSTLTSLGQGHGLDLDAAGSLATWAGLELAYFVRPRPVAEKVRP